MIEKLGRYEILEEIGQGGFAIVYRAHDTELERLVALKELKPVLFQDTEWAKRFRREARAIARLDHSHIVTIYDVCEIEQRLFIVMRLVNGPSLEELITTRERLLWSEAVEIMTEVAGGLDYAHTQGVLHRDLKPANILIDPERGPMLSDFGLAKLTSESSMSMTASGSVVGTPHYIAPEVWEGQSATAKADIYAVGCILYEMLTGEKVFKGETPPAVMMAHFRPLVLPERWPADVPSGVTRVLKTALAGKPAARYATAREMVEALAKLSQAERLVQPPVPAPKETRPEAEQRQLETVELTPEVPGQQEDKAVVDLEQPSAAAPMPQPSAPTPVITPTPSQVTPAQQRKRRSGCFWISLVVVVGLVLLLIVGTGTFCSTVGGIFNTALATVEVGSVVTEPIRVPLPDHSDTISLELELDTGELLLAPGAEGVLVEGTATYNVEQLKPEVLTSGRKVRLKPEGNIGLGGMLTEELKNKWDLKLAAVPMELVVNAEKAQGILELGDLSLVDLTVKQGAADFKLSFSEPNQVEMDTLRFEAGASRATLTDLANARAKEIIFEGAAGEYTLDFDGELQGDLDVGLAVRLSDVTIIVPEDVAAEVFINNGDSSDITTKGAWQKSADNYYLLPGEGHQIRIDAEMGPGHLELRTR